MFSLRRKSSMTRWRQFGCLLTAVCLALFPLQVTAQDNQIISLELNKVETIENSCELTFLLNNTSETGLEKLALEFAFLDQGGQLARLATLNFGTVSSDRPKISQFALSGISCESISQSFINSASECIGLEGMDCLSAIATKNKTNIGF